MRMSSGGGTEGSGGVAFIEGCRLRTEGPGQFPDKHIAVTLKLAFQLDRMRRKMRVVTGDVAGSCCCYCQPPLLVCLLYRCATKVGIYVMLMIHI